MKKKWRVVKFFAAECEMTKDIQKSFKFNEYLYIIELSLYNHYRINDSDYIVFKLNILKLLNNINLNVKIS